jgi:hypothetical protein
LPIRKYVQQLIAALKTFDSGIPEAAATSGATIVIDDDESEAGTVSEPVQVRRLFVCLAHLNHPGSPMATTRALVAVPV